MPFTTPSARLHLLPASAAPVAVILRRKPTRLYHVMLWRTDKDAIEHGSWFRGTLLNHDLSPDGAWMTYTARGSRGNIWSALCRPPRLRAAAYNPEAIPYWPYACFRDDGRVDAYWWFEPPKSDMRPDERRDMPAIYIQPQDATPPASPLLARAWFRRVEQAKDQPLRPHWLCQPTPKHPAIRLFNPRSTTGRGRIEVDGLDLVLDPARDWACYDSRHQLLIARQGRVERWSLRDLKKGKPGFVQDLEPLTPPPRKPKPNSDTEPN